MSKPLSAAAMLLVTACSAPKPEPANSPTTASAPADASARMVAAIGHARATLDAGAPRDALTEIDALAELAPDDARVWLLRGDACLAAARNDSEPAFYYVDALRAYGRAIELGGGRRALFGASFAARMGGKLDEALDYARRGMADAAPPEPDGLRTAIEATFDKFIATKQQGGDADALYRETEELVLALLEQTPDDAWALHTLANLFEWNGRGDAAVEPLAHLVDVAPDDETAHNRLTALMRASEGREGVIAHYTAFRKEHEGNALGSWYLAAETFEQAVDDLWAQRDSRAEFARAEALFATCREEAAKFADACVGYEVVCRAGAGWCMFNAGELDAAERAFLSTEELRPGGAHVEIAGRVLSGVKGLQFVADRALRESVGTDDGVTPGLARAAAIYAKLRHIAPDDAAIANNCGFFHREVGVAALSSSRLSSFPPRANEALAAARAALTESRDAYLEAARLAPEDVRIVNDSALILVYHFPSRAADAERMLLRCVELGAAQKDDPALGAEARDALLEAWGDAHQNLGALHLLLRHDGVAAKPWFEKCFEIGPRPRVDRAWVAAEAIPWCERVAAGETLDPLDFDPRFGSVE